MVFFIMILLMIALTGADFAKPGEFNTDYLKKKNTTAINGLFVILVLFSHYAQYADFSGPYDIPYLVLRKHLKQMVVATFMFYSGYGMMEAIRTKGDVYINKIPDKFWKLLLRFDIAVLLYLLLNAALGIRYPIERVLLAFTTWTAVGNSNWYITAVLILYIILYVSFKPCISGGNYRNKRIWGIALTFAITAVAIYIQIKIGRPDYCYNTMMILPLGCLYSELRGDIEKIIMRSDAAYLIVLTIVTGVYIVSFFHRESFGIAGYTFWGMAFIAMVLLVTMKLSVYNGFLEWTGIHVFGIYILQRIPMSILDQMGYIENHKYMSLVAAIVASFAMAAVFQKYTDKLIRFITARRT
ncbi:MAG: hypothetical protein IJJ06_09395 [Mogibacterium sp.]|nr:hypothetical protein [Mogibacterium sp.]